MEKIKVGSIIVMTKSNNGQTQYIGEKLKVIEVRNDSLIVETKHKVKFTIYDTKPSDSYFLYSKENMIKYLVEKKADLEKELSEMQSKIDFYNNYESEEEFVAEKLEKLMSANSKGKSKEERVKLMTDILKTLKESDLL